MKKFLASGGLILASLAYVLFQHLGNDTEAAEINVIPSGGTTPAPVTTTKAGQPFGATQTLSSEESSESGSESGSENDGSTKTTTPTSVPTPKPAPVPAPEPTPTPAPAPSGMYRDGSYTGIVADAYYGYVQVKAIVSGGKLANVQILQYPNDRSTSKFINGQALPMLTQEAITAQTGNVDTVSGASDTSMAFRQSLTAALAQAKN